MLSLTWGGLVARATLLLSASNTVKRAHFDTYSSNTLDAILALQTWYDEPTGLWNSTSWWNAANCLTVLADWAKVDGYGVGARTVKVADIFSNTFTKAQLSPVAAKRPMRINGLVTSATTPINKAARGFSGFINQYYDDEGWWALAWIRAWDVTRRPAYLAMAQYIFEDMRKGSDPACGGGIWWNKERRYKNAIANELYLTVAASLANRVPGPDKRYYLNQARRTWTWFRHSGLINDDYLVNDGLAIRPDGSCVNNGLPTWSYNQGVLLGGLVELARATGKDDCLDAAEKIALAAIEMLGDEDGVFHETDHCEPACGGDGSQFKGIFVRNLGYLYQERPRREFRDAILANADSIWERNRDGKNRLGIRWDGPASAGTGPNAATHSSALDVLVAAMAVSQH